MQSLYHDLTEEKTQAFINRLMTYNHASPIEHASFTFGIEGVSRSMTHQLVRHRLASYSQKSQRYVSEGQFDYIIPPAISAIPEAREIYVQTMESAQSAYQQIEKKLRSKYEKELKADGENVKKIVGIAEKQAIEDARFVLPNGCETKIIVTMNVRELLHFFRNRCCMRAQWEIRECATQMLTMCKAVAPTLFKNAGPACVGGPCPEGQMSCKKGDEIRIKYKNL